MRSIRRPAGALALVVVATLAVGLGISSPAVATDYPSWGDVQHAKQNVATKKAEIAKLKKLLGSLETQAAASGKVALQKGEEYSIARDQLDAATAKANRLASTAERAAARATASSQQAGQLVAQLARTSGNSLSLGLFLNGSNASDLLSRLGSMSKLSEHEATVYKQARIDRNSALALTAEARLAQKSRSTLAGSARAALAAAKQASQNALARVAEQSKLSSRMYAQLASLEGKSAATVKEYLAGLAWEAAQAAVKNPPPAAPPVNPTPPAPSGSAVAGAIAFARAQLGEAYVLNGMGPNVWDCSGLTKAAYASVGVYIGTHSATNQYNTMRAAGRLVPLAEMVAGDLLWYSNGGSTGGDKYHVTLYIGGGLMIEAPYPGAVVRIKPVRYGDLVPYAGRPTP